MVNRIGLFKDERNLQGPLRDYVPLTQNGIHQAEQVIIKHPFLSECELILSSPFTRSLQTAAIINRTLGLPLHVEYDLNEWIPDKFQAKTFDEIQKLTNDYFDHKGCWPPGEDRIWETKESVMHRTRNVFMRYLDKSKVLVACHGMMIAILMNYGPGEVELCSVHEYQLGEQNSL
jgi:broad specificity phosphatase PhoE